MAAPKIIPYDVELRSVNPVRSFDRPKAYTNDLNSVRFQFKVLDMTSEELTTATAVTLVYMRDGSFFANPSTDVSRVGNVFSYLLKENEGNHAGVAQIQLVVIVDGMELASQLFDFEIINGLETKVAQEVMIYDWTTLTRDAQDYIDQFVSNETTRQQQFADAQTQRGTTFGESEAGRTTIFNASEAGRTTTFNASEAGRTTAFNAAEEARATGYDADHSRAGTDHTTAVDDHALAGVDHTTAVNDHTLAGTDHTTAVNDHTTALADHATISGYNGRLTTVESDTILNASNLITNGDFSNGVTAWGGAYATITAANNILTATGLASPSYNYMAVSQTTPNTPAVGDILYTRATVAVQDDVCTALTLSLRGTTGILPVKEILLPVKDTQYGISATTLADGTTVGAIALRIQTAYVSAEVTANKTFTVKNVLVMNLTSIFGKGNEPTADQMDYILSQFTNYRFEGTSNLFLGSQILKKQISVEGRLMTIESAASLKTKNLLLNSNFINGYTGWNGNSYSTLSVSNGVLSATATGNAAYSTAIQSVTSQPAIVGDLYYTMFRYSVHDNSCSSVNIFVRDSLNISAVTNISILAPRNGVIYQHSFVNQIPAGFSGTIVSRVQSNYPDAATATGKVLKVYNAVLINLTSIFGKGKEPTAEQMDKFLSRFPNGWFDGTITLFSADTLIKNQIAIDNRTEFEARNALVNADYSAGNDKWIPYADSVLPVVNGDYLEFTPTTLSSGVGQEFVNTSYHKYYFKFTMKADIATSVSNGFSTEGVAAHTITSPVGTTDSDFSFITTPTSTMNRIVFGKPSATGGKLYLKKNALVINLTETFGAGNEPTLAQMEAIIARIGTVTSTKQIASVQDLYNVKANRLQEAWITPTLVNSWVAFDTRTAKYKKSELGRVYLKGIVKSGTIGATIFTLPTGYRPDEALTYAIASNGVFGYVTVNTDGTVICTLGSNASVSLSGISFFV